MAKKRSSESKIQFTLSTGTLRRLSPWRVLGILGLVVLVGFIFLWLLQVLLYGLALVGLVYVIYLFLKKRR